MKYLKIKTTDKRIIIIDLEKVVSYMVGDDFVNVNYYGDDFFHFTSCRSIRLSNCYYKFIIVM